MSRSWALLLFLLAPVTARADDLKDIIDRDKLAVQKLTSEVSLAMATASAFGKADPERAKKALEGALAKVAASREVSEEQRTNFRQRLQTRLNEVNSRLRIQEQAEADAAKRAADKVRREQQNNSSGRKGTGDTAKKYIGSIQDQIAAAKRISDMRAKGNLGVLSSLEVSATPIDGVMEYSPHWKQLTENRKNFAGHKLSAKEVALLKALNSTLSVNFKDTAFKDVIEYLQEKTGLSIIVDEGSLKEAMVEYSDPVSFKVNKVTVRTILRKVLADRGLAYVLREGTVQVVTPQKARETMVVRSYPIDDLVGGISNRLYGPLVTRAIMLSNVQTLIQNIQNAIEPSIWNVNGGPATITFSEIGPSLTIRAPAELHYMMGGGGF